MFLENWDLGSACNIYDLEAWYICDVPNDDTKCAILVEQTEIAKEKQEIKTPHTHEFQEIFNSLFVDEYRIESGITKNLALVFTNGEDVAKNRYNADDLDDFNAKMAFNRVQRVFANFGEHKRATKYMLTGQLMGTILREIHLESEQRKQILRQKLQTTCDEIVGRKQMLCQKLQTICDEIVDKIVEKTPLDRENQKIVTEDTNNRKITKERKLTIQNTITANPTKKCEKEKTTTARRKKNENKTPQKEKKRQNKNAQPTKPQTHEQQPPEPPDKNTKFCNIGEDDDILREYECDWNSNQISPVLPIVEDDDSNFGESAIYLKKGEISKFPLSPDTTPAFRNEVDAFFEGKCEVGSEIAETDAEISEIRDEIDEYVGECDEIGEIIDEIGEDSGEYPIENSDESSDDDEFCGEDEEESVSWAEYNEEEEGEGVDSDRGDENTDSDND